MPHARFAMGAGLVNWLAELRAEEQTRLCAARDHAEVFCRQNGIAMRDKRQFDRPLHWISSQHPFALDYWMGVVLLGLSS
jgi:hypothetical protein